VAAQAALTAVFLAATALRLFVATRRRPRSERVARDSDASLPRYTIVAALYDEVEALPDLMAALNALDYPAEKIEIALVLEADDEWTRLVAQFLQSKIRFDVVLAAGQGPRTKPKALNCVLPFARGDLIVVYDAEDRPEPDQLRLAAQAFADADETLVCVQARLTIDNTHDTWLSRLFTAEYAGLFDVLLPGLASLRLPIPLGGSSNHFRASALRAVGAWDPYNVTEDADLGIRIARFGYASGVIASTTYEEAPSQLGPWLRQRTRWFKGWMQTLLVHMREPRRLWRELGIGGAAAFYLILGGTSAAALVQPLVLVWLAAAWIAGAAIVPAAAPLPLIALGWAHLAALVTGYATSALLGLVGLKRRRLTRAAWAFVALPLLWLLMSVAAWRAVIQLLFNPQLWEKTQHGRARTSRLGEAGAVSSSGACRPRPLRDGA
jgi:cellulose synthase/poly-beta-1,6-N-acetylglucosamine synthase-like glycosyltransferase